MNFLTECLADLDQGLRAHGLRLVVAKGNPKDVFTKLFSHYEVKTLTFEAD